MIESFVLTLTVTFASAPDPVQYSFIARDRRECEAMSQYYEQDALAHGAENVETKCQKSLDGVAI